MDDRLTTVVIITETSGKELEDAINVATVDIGIGDGRVEDIKYTVMYVPTQDIVLMSAMIIYTEVA